MRSTPTTVDAFLERATDRLRTDAERRRAAGNTDERYAVVRSETGRLQDGIPLETSMSQCDCCAERHATNNVLYEARDQAVSTDILVASPVPDEPTPPTTPSGACRHVINQFSDDATVSGTTYSRDREGWPMVAQRERDTATELSPEHVDPDGWD